MNGVTKEGLTSVLALGFSPAGSYVPFSLTPSGDLSVSVVNGSPAAPAVGHLFSTEIPALSNFNYYWDTTGFESYRGFFVSFTGNFAGLVPFGVAALNDPTPGALHSITTSFDLQSGGAYVFHPLAKFEAGNTEVMATVWLPGAVRLSWAFTTGADATTLNLKVVMLP